MENQHLSETKAASSQEVEKLQEDVSAIKIEDQEKEEKAQNIGAHDDTEFDNKLDDISDVIKDVKDGRTKSDTDAEINDNVIGDSDLVQAKTETEVKHVGQEYSGDKVEAGRDFEPKSEERNLDDNSGQDDLAKEENVGGGTESTDMDRKADEIPNEDSNLDPVFDGTEIPGMEANRSTSIRKSDGDQDSPGVVEKAVALKNLVKEKSAVAVSTVLRRLSGKSDEAAVGNFDDEGKDISDISEVEAKLVSEKPVEKSAWNPLNYIKKSSDVDAENKTDGPPLPIALKGRIILYTKLGCQESKIFRLFLRTKRLRYVEINIDVYPSRKMELEKISGSTSVPKLFFNEICIGGLSELKNLDESGKLDEKIDFLITEAPLFETPSPPFSGEDDISSTGAVDELALIARKMKESIIVKDRLYKMRRFTNCFLGSDALDFLSEDQYLERQEVSLSRASYHHI
jgi:glutaredoxin